MKGFPHLRFQRHWELTEKSLYQLGECDAMVRSISITPLRPKERKSLMSMSFIKGAQATTAIEGNTLSQEEVERIFEGEELPPSREYLQIEVQNVLEAFNYLHKEVIHNREEWPITPNLIQQFHQMISKDLGKHLDAIPGKWRVDGRQVGPYLAPDHRKVDDLMSKLCNWIREEFHFNREQDFKTAVVQAIVTHVYTEWIHPFGDGNGRTGRLIEFYILLRAGLPDIASHILSNFYNLTRTAYYRQLNEGRKQRDLTDFIEYAIEGFRDGLVENLKIIQSSQFKIFWRNHIYTTFADLKYTKKAVFKRKRNMMMSIPIESWKTPEEIITASPEVTMEYLSKGAATIRRDLEEMVELELLVKDGKKYHANIAVLHASLPQRK